MRLKSMVQYSKTVCLQQKCKKQRQEDEKIGKTYHGNEG